MTTLAEIDMQNTLAEYVKAQLPQWDGEPCWTLPPGRTGFTSMDQVGWLHQTVAKPAENQLIAIYDNWLALQTMVENEAQQSVVIAAGAQTQAQNIPNWAGWTEAQVLSWFDTNITNAIAPIGNLADAKAVLTQIATAQRAMARMIVALRNKNFPGLQD